MTCMYIQSTFYHKKESKHLLKDLHKSSMHVDSEKKSKEKVSMNWMHYGSNMFFSQMNEVRWEHGLSFHCPVLSMSIQSRLLANVSLSRLGSPGYQFVMLTLAFEWSHTYLPSVSMSFNPVQAEQRWSLSQVKSENRGWIYFIYFTISVIWGLKGHGYL